MTEDARIVQLHQVTTPRGEFLETLAKRYRYSQAGTIRRPAQAGLLADVVYCADGRVYYHTGFSERGIPCILPSGRPRFILPMGTVGVLPQTLPGSPVSGETYVSQVHLGARPWVELNVLCSGVNTLLLLAMAADRPGDSGRGNAPSRPAPAPPVGAWPQVCPRCHKRTIYWDDGLRCYWCYSCAWSEPIV